MNLNSLNLFLKIAQRQSLTLAAEDLNLTVSAVSQSIKRLQDDLGIDLIKKTGRGISLTTEGHLLAKKLEKNFTDLDHIISQIKTDRPDNQFDGTLTIGLYTGFSTESLVAVMATIQAQYNVKFKIVVGSGKFLFNQLEKGKIDLAICLSVMGGNSLFTSEKLFSEKLILVSSTKPPRRKLDVQELLNAPIVDYFEGHTLMSKWFHFHFKKKLKSANVKCYVPTARLVLDCILRDIGIGVVPYSLAKDYVKEGRLFVIKAQGPQLTIDTVVYQSSSSNKELVALFVDIFKSHVVF